MPFPCTLMFPENVVPTCPVASDSISQKLWLRIQVYSWKRKEEDIDMGPGERGFALGSSPCHIWKTKGQKVALSSPPHLHLSVPLAHETSNPTLVFCSLSEWRYLRCYRLKLVSWISSSPVSAFLVLSSQKAPEDKGDILSLPGKLSSKRKAIHRTVPPNSS